MATNTEIRTTLKSWYYDLLKTKKDNGSIDELIEKMKATMDAEDVAYVEKIINKE
ncbi:MAG: hypothetical protein FWD34_05290 [Oscillospiraceae bacterium]|nr:hypothetical protein [Oscillospiraceae bacterium]